MVQRRRRRRQRRQGLLQSVLANMIEFKHPTGLDLPTSKKEEAKETEGGAKGEVEPKEAKRPRKGI